jgi:hypothetical protein
MADGSGAAPAAEGGATTAAAGGSTAAPAATPSAGATPGAGAGTAAVTGTPAAAPAWHGELSADDIGWLQTKGWFGTDLAKAEVQKTFPAMVKAYRTTESFVGRNKVALPKDANDTEGWDQFYAAAGRPPSPEAYEYKVPEGGDQAFGDAYAKMAHKYGLSTRQMQGLAADWNEFGMAQHQARAEAADHQFATQSAADVDAIRREWGAQYDPKMAAAQRAGHGFGISKETMNKIERAIGTKDFLSMMANIGAAVSEDTGSVPGETGSSGHMTPEMAGARLKELQKDAAWLAKYQAGDQEAMAEKRKLDMAMAG